MDQMNRPQNRGGSIVQQSRIKRTLLFAGVFALLAMIYVPTPRHSTARLAAALLVGHGGSQDPGTIMEPDGLG
jgi:hypothetical protein